MKPPPCVFKLPSLHIVFNDEAIITTKNPPRGYAKSEDRMQYNKVFIMGHLTRDPDIKNLTTGVPVCNFSVATNERYTDQTGEKVDSVCFVSCEAWNEQAEAITETLRKGNLVLIEGKLIFNTWESPTGEKRDRLKVRVFHFQLLGASETAENAERSTSPPKRALQNSAVDITDTSVSADIPF